MTKNINEEQLRNIVSECVNSVLSEIYLQGGGSTAKNPKVKVLGDKAMIRGAGNSIADTPLDAAIKRSGGMNQNETLDNLFRLGIEGDEDAQKHFFKAMAHMEDVSDKIKIILMKCNRRIKGALNNWAAEE